ncbi:hypothetical protein K492DRAFT_232218 [Lichtheimia hyalospora FSU 10163]|nr:hypothetical protein K492DRAFT_232218 [Lichtheimia hyalospora FSU 10163]
MFLTIQLKQNGLNDRLKKNPFDHCFSDYGSNGSSKISFDHRKAMFGMFATIQTVAQLHSKASFDTYTRLTSCMPMALSMSTQAPGIYIMTKKQKVNVPISFLEKDMTIDPFTCFFKILAETLLVLKELKQGHKTVLRSKDKQQGLCSIINPIVIRLHESKHTSIVHDHGSTSVPSSSAKA